MTTNSRTTLEETAFLFPGQGSQTVGMGRAFDDAWPETRTAFDRLDEAVDIDLRALRFDGSEAAIRSPGATQPLLLATGFAVSEGVRRRFDVDPAFLAGHSLGHFTALAAARALDPVAAVELTRERGRCMERAAARDGPGTMVAALLADPARVTGACGARDDVGVALYNAPKQTVISGTRDGVAAVRDRLEAEADRVRFRELEVDAAFHSPVMASAVDPVEAAMAAVDLREAAVPIVSDVSGAVYTEPRVAARDLTAQVTDPIDWVRVVERLRERGVERFVEFPPAGVLSSLVERIAPEADCVALETPADAREVFA